MPNLAKLGDVFITVLEEESYEYSNDITERAMEDGSKITDHAKSNLIKIKISGIITGKGAYPQEKLTKLRMYCLNRTILKYIGMQSFSNVIIENFGNQHTTELADGIEFDITLKELRFAKRTAARINTSKLRIPDIEKLKDQLEEKKKAKEEAKRAKTQAKSNRGRQTKR